MDARPGTYALILRARRSVPTLQVGRCGTLRVQPGWYVYIGSAFGPGGVRARLRHHCRVSATPRWHIDYLRRAAEPETVWYTYDPQPREHSWAGSVGRLRSACVPLPGFGASDCSCLTHLFFFSRLPRVSVFRRRVRAAVLGHARIASAALQTAAQPLGGQGGKARSAKLSAKRQRAVAKQAAAARWAATAAD